MATILDLPRELFLEVCSYVAATDLARLAGVTKDHYLAVQEPLYADVQLRTYDSLIKLVGTLVKAPIVSRISARQRALWHKLSEAQLLDRDIRRLDVLLDSNSQYAAKITGAVLARCVGAISRKCPKAKITLRIYGSWLRYEEQMSNVSLPNVVCLISYRQRHSVIKDYEIMFGGSTFPDLKEVQVDATHTWPDSAPHTLAESASIGSSNRQDYFNYYEGFKGHGDYIMPFYGLQRMESIRIKHSALLPSTLNSLFGSTVIPKRLTKLEIEQCPALHPIQRLDALSMLLRRALPLLRHLKLHLVRLDNYHGDMDPSIRYAHEIAENPEHHLCPIVRDLGQNLSSLDLALPYACSAALLPPPKHWMGQCHGASYPPILREPLDTIPQRLQQQGYKHRRLICWHGVCRGETKWDELASVSSVQGEGVSWEVLHADGDEGVWSVSGCLPVKFSASSVLQHRCDTDL